MNQLSYEERKRIRRAAEDARDACNPRFGPFIDVVAHPLNILALVGMADRAAPARELPAIPPGWDGSWKWMTHPDWNDGEPIPVQTWVETDGAIYYRPFDGNATSFEWLERSDEWKEVEALQPPMDPELEDFAEQLIAWHDRKVKSLKGAKDGLKEGTKLLIGEDDPNPKTLSAEQAKWMGLGVEIALLELGSLPFKLERHEDTDGEDV